MNGSDKRMHYIKAYRKQLRREMNEMGYTRRNSQRRLVVSYKPGKLNRLMLGCWRGRPRPLLGPFDW
jgi:hypothetical protein